VIFDCALQEMGRLTRSALLEGNGAEGVPTTTLIVAPNAYPDDFEAFNEFVLSAEDYMHRSSLDDDFQLVAFHPKFCFAGEVEDDASNFANRSPYPTLHVLRQADVTAAVDEQPQLAGSVPRTNKLLLRRLGVAKLSELVHGTRDDGDAIGGGESDVAANHGPRGE
jgi:hypothetical protein